MRKLKVFISVCLLTTSLPTSVLASYTLDQNNNGIVDIQDIAQTVQNNQNANAITGKNAFNKEDIQNLLSQIKPLNQQSLKGTVTGIVYDEAGIAVAGADVTLDGTTTIVHTDYSGKFEFNNVPVTFQTIVHVKMANYVDVNSDVFNILAGDTRNLGTMILRKTYGSVSGYVYGPDQQVLNAALVTIDGSTPPLSTLTDLTGYFTLSQVPTGTRNLTVTMDTYVSTSQSILIETNSLTTLAPIQLQKATSPQVTGSIHGQVMSANNPLSDASVRATGTSFATNTDMNGFFTLTDLPLGITELDIMRQDYQPIHISGITVSASVYELGPIWLSPNTTAPQLTSVSTGVLELDHQVINATVNEAATLYLVPRETTPTLEEIRQHVVTSTWAEMNKEATLQLSSVTPGDYVLYAIDAENNVSTPSDTITVIKSVSMYLTEIRHGLEISNMTGITKNDFTHARLQNINDDQIELYQFALAMDKYNLLDASSDPDFIAKMQEWIDIANAAPAIQRALMSGFSSPFDWSVLNENYGDILSSYELSGISSLTQLTVAEHLMEAAYKRGNYKLLTRAAIQAVLNSTTPSLEHSSWLGTPIKQGPGTKQVALSLSLKNSNDDSLKGFTADDFSMKVNGVETSLGNTDVFPSFTYDDVTSSYQIMFAGSDNSKTYTLSDFAYISAEERVVIQSNSLSVTTPDPAVPVTSIGLTLLINNSRVATHSSNALKLTIEPFNATNKDIVWSIAPSGIAAVNQYGSLDVTGIGRFTLTATNPLSGRSQSLELEAVDSTSALLAVQAYATSGGTTSLSLEDLKNTCVNYILDSAFENYKRALVAKRGEFEGLSSTEVSNLLQTIIGNYTYNAPLNQVLYDYSISNNPTEWDAYDLEELTANGIYHADATNVQYAKQVIWDTYRTEGGPLSGTQLTSLVSKVPSFSIRGFNPTVYATQMMSQHLNNQGSNVVVTFKVANMYGEGNTSLTSQDVKTNIGGTSRDLSDPTMFSNFTNLGGGLYSFEVLQSVLASPIMISALTIRVGYSDVPIATNVSVNRQAALIENAVANHNLNIVDELLFTVGNLPSLLGIEFISLKNNLEFAYTAHGNVLTESTISRIINGMHVVASQSKTTSADNDTYRLSFYQNVTGSLYYSVSARNQIGFLAMSSTSAYSNIYDFTFKHTSMFPVVLTYVASATEMLRYTSDNSPVPDFEIIFTEPTS